MRRKPPIAPVQPSRTRLLICLVVGLCLACTAPPDPRPTARDANGHVPVDSSAAFLELAERHAAQILATAPEWASTLGVPQAVAGEGYTGRWSDFSPAADAEAQALLSRLQRELQAISRGALRGTAVVTYDIMENAYDQANRRNGFSMGAASILGANPPYPVTQLSGVHIEMPRLLASAQPLGQPADLDAYLSRVGGMAAVLDQTVAMLKKDAEAGLGAPAFALRGSANSIRALIAPSPAEHPIVETLRRGSESIQGLTPERRAQAISRAEQYLADKVYPAYRRMAEALDELAESADDTPGLWRHADGDRLYQFFLDSYGANGKTAEEIHRIGLEEVARIHREMDRILRDMGRSEGGVGARMSALASDPAVLIANDDPSKEAMLASLRDEVATIMELAPAWFGTLPSQQVEVRRIPVYEQDGSAGGYYTGPSLDGSRPGIFWINLKDTADWPTYSWKTMTYHEAVPGHHFQVSLQQAVQDMPLVRNMLFYSEYGEGWALYAEKLAVEMGMYRDDPLGNLGRLRFELYRAVRLVIDTGLHHKRWSREQAITWMMENIGETRPAATREVERYAVWPGQATSYKLGMLQIEELRREAERRLGSRFDLRSFHDTILLAGSMPLPVLERRVREWIELELQTKTEKP